MTMELPEKEVIDKGVNGRISNGDVVALCRWRHDWQVPIVRNHGTAGGLPRHAERMSESRDRATARIDCCKRIATWNVNTLYQAVKLDILRREAERIRLDVVGVSEVRWTGSGKIASGGRTLYYSGGERYEAGVGVMMRSEEADPVVDVWQVSESVMLVKIDAKPTRMNIIQVYAPTSDHSDDEVDNFYQQVDSVRGQCKSGEVP